MPRMNLEVGLRARHKREPYIPSCKNNKNPTIDTTKEKDITDIKLKLYNNVIPIKNFIVNFDAGMYNKYIYIAYNSYIKQHIEHEGKYNYINTYLSSAKIQELFDSLDIVVNYFNSQIFQSDIQYSHINQLYTKKTKEMLGIIHHVYEVITKATYFIVEIDDIQFLDVDKLKYEVTEEINSFCRYLYNYNNIEYTKHRKITAMHLLEVHADFEKLIELIANIGKSPKIFAKAITTSLKEFKTDVFKIYYILNDDLDIWKESLDFINTSQEEYSFNACFDKDSFFTFFHCKDWLNPSYNTCELVNTKYTKENFNNLHITRSYFEASFEVGNKMNVYLYAMYIDNIALNRGNELSYLEFLQSLFKPKDLDRFIDLSKDCIKFLEVDKDKRLNINDSIFLQRYYEVMLLLIYKKITLEESFLVLDKIIDKEFESCKSRALKYIEDIKLSNTSIKIYEAIMIYNYNTESFRAMLINNIAPDSYALARGHISPEIKEIDNDLLMQFFINIIHGDIEAIFNKIIKGYNNCIYEVCLMPYNIFDDKKYLKHFGFKEIMSFSSISDYHVIRYVNFTSLVDDLIKNPYIYFDDKVYDFIGTKQWKVEIDQKHLITEMETETIKFHYDDL